MNQGLWEAYAIRYAWHHRSAKENFLGGDAHDGPMPIDYFVWAVRCGERTFVIDTGFDEAMARNIAPGSTAGLPGLVLPSGLTPSGLPVALEFDGPAGSDIALLALGLALEPALGKLPPPPAVASG